ncbi:hypothetical protein GQ602_005384 [Ophiocordyceps camponoti-floridani]|uniref:Uncharacterized protein n=1 Tax=Ophiocordyceps camponoti-floridani TaxID=2030778 RepID=A0A8H4VCY4_9HYPO|nr:hypothetical protein GQ602_005384 [Ophiocordyceps camponoti-floridani]
MHAHVALQVLVLAFGLANASPIPREPERTDSQRERSNNRAPTNNRQLGGQGGAHQPNPLRAVWQDRTRFVQAPGGRTPNQQARQAAEAGNRNGNGLANIGRRPGNNGGNQPRSLPSKEEMRLVAADEGRYGLDEERASGPGGEPLGIRVDRV